MLSHCQLLTHVSFELDSIEIPSDDNSMRTMSSKKNCDCLDTQDEESSLSLLNGLRQKSVFPYILYCKAKKLAN